MSGSQGSTLVDGNKAQSPLYNTASMKVTEESGATAVFSQERNYVGWLEVLCSPL